MIGIFPILNTVK